MAAAGLGLALSAASPAGAEAARSDSPAIEWITLGTGGGPVIRTQRSEPANALRVGDAVYLFDLGAGAQKRLAEAGLDPRQVRAIFLSHLHIDHTADLAPFLLNRWVLNDYRPLPVIGPRGTGGTLDGIAAMSGPIRLAPVTIGGPPKPPFTGTFSPRELAPAMDRPTLVYADANLRVLAITNAHYNFPSSSPEARYARSYAFRIEAGGKSYVFTGDTGMSDKLVDLARGADVLVSEVIDMAGIEATLARSGIPPKVLPA
ncbi:MAG: MBL fold metallo-hydrolase, partial [Sphingomonadales bacterium]|nr:MBL fold metallo-hydrolase [Sphingomonadales bacterium]